MACKRHINDLKRQGTDAFPFIFDEEKAFRPIDYIQRFCKPSQGDYDRLELQPWQHFIIGSLYGWVHKDTGLRRFREGLILLAGKTGKPRRFPVFLYMQLPKTEKTGRGCSSSPIQRNRRGNCLMSARLWLRHPRS